MGLVKFNEETLTTFKDRYNSYTNEIVNALNNISREIGTIDKILNTPKTTKTVPLVLDYYDKQIKYVKNSIDTFNKDLTTIITEYESFDSDVRSMVGE